MSTETKLFLARCVQVLGICLILLGFHNIAHAHVLGQEACVTTYGPNSVSVKCFPTEVDQEHNLNHRLERQVAIKAVTDGEIQRVHESAIEAAKFSNALMLEKAGATRVGVSVGTRIENTSTSTSSA